MFTFALFAVGIIATGMLAVPGTGRLRGFVELSLRHRAELPVQLRELGVPFGIGL